METTQSPTGIWQITKTADECTTHLTLSSAKPCVHVAWSSQTKQLYCSLMCWVSFTQCAKTTPAFKHLITYNSFWPSPSLPGIFSRPTQNYDVLLVLLFLWCFPPQNIFVEVLLQPILKPNMDALGSWPDKMQMSVQAWSKWNWLFHTQNGPCPSVFAYPDRRAVVA